MHKHTAVRCITSQNVYVFSHFSRCNNRGERTGHRSPLRSPRRDGTCGSCRVLCLPVTCDEVRIRDDDSGQKRHLPSQNALMNTKLQYGAVQYRGNEWQPPRGEALSVLRLSGCWRAASRQGTRNGTRTGGRTAGEPAGREQRAVTAVPDSLSVHRPTRGIERSPFSILSSIPHL